MSHPALRRCLGGLAVATTLALSMSLGSPPHARADLFRPGAESLPQLWSVEVDGAVLRALDKRVLKRLRAARGTLVPVGLAPDGRKRLGRIARRWDVRVLRTGRLGSCAASKRSRPGTRCGVRVRSLSRAGVALRSKAIDAVVVPISRQRRFRRISGGGAPPRLIGVLRLSTRPGRVARWRRAIRAARRSKHVDLAVRPVGPNKAAALVRYVRLVARHGRGDRRPPSLPAHPRLAATGATDAALTWRRARDARRVVAYGLYRDGVYLGASRRPRASFRDLACGSSLLEIDAVDRGGNRSAKRWVRASTGACAPPAPSEPTMGNLWVDQDGGSCVYRTEPALHDDATACGSLDAAYDVANQRSEPSLVLVRGGTYAYDGDNTREQITGSRSSPNRITIAAGAGEVPVFQGRLVLGNGDEVEAGPDFLTLRNLTLGQFGSGFQNPGNRFGLFMLAGTTNVRAESIIQGGWLMQGVKDVHVVGGSSGPCRAPSLPEFGGTANPCELNKLDWAAANPPIQTERVTVDGVEFHDFDYPPACELQAQNGDGCHHRTMFINGVNGFTLRNSTFRDHVFMPWTTICCDAKGNSNLLIENNQFGAQVFWQAGEPAKENYFGFDFAWCQNGAQPSYRNVTFRFNSFARLGGLGVPGWVPEVGGCQVDNFEVYGNIFGYRANCGSYLAGGTRINWHHNVYAGGVGGTCGGSGERNIGGSTMPFYSDDDAGPEHGDYRLRGPAFAADNLVPASAGCPSTDATGHPRGAGGTCDAGAHER